MKTGVNQTRVLAVSAAIGILLILLVVVGGGVYLLKGRNGGRTSPKSNSAVSSSSDSNENTDVSLSTPQGTSTPASSANSQPSTPGDVNNNSDPSDQSLPADTNQDVSPPADTTKEPEPKPQPEDNEKTITGQWKLDVNSAVFPLKNIQITLKSDHTASVQQTAVEGLKFKDGKYEWDSKTRKIKATCDGEMSYMGITVPIQAVFEGAADSSLKNAEGTYKATPTMQGLPYEDTGTFKMSR